MKLDLSAIAICFLTPVYSQVYICEYFCELLGRSFHDPACDPWHSYTSLDWFAAQCRAHKLCALMGLLNSMNPSHTMSYKFCHVVLKVACWSCQLLMFISMLGQDKVQLSYYTLAPTLVVPGIRANHSATQNQQTSLASKPYFPCFCWAGRERERGKYVWTLHGRLSVPYAGITRF